LTLIFAIIPCLTQRKWVHLITATAFFALIICMTGNAVIKG
jgi:hypothetical protein